jgi:predicted amidohydrolase YtcJ
LNNPDHPDQADLVLYNARIITMDRKQPYTSLAAIRGNRILYTGDGDDLPLFRGLGTKIIDCAGGTVIPGFNDAHCHPLSLAINLVSLDCSPDKVKDIQGILDLVHQAAGHTRTGKWIRAVNYDEFQLKEKRPPNRWELDRVCPENPLIILHRTAGKCLLNSLAFQLVQPSGSTVHIDPVKGEPDGLITGRNARLENLLPGPDEEELETGMRLVNTLFLSQGITSFQDTTWNNNWSRWRIWQKLTEHGLVSQRVSFFSGFEAIDEFANLPQQTLGSDNRLQMAGIKLALDESTGEPHPPQQDINRFALKACQTGFNVAFHVSDVPMLETSLAAIKFIHQTLPDKEPGFRLEHCAVCPPDLLFGLKASRAVVIAQPSFIYYFGQPFLDEVLPHQTNWFEPFGSFKRWGLTTAFSSDSPLTGSNPLTGIYAAVSRMTEKGQKLAPQESISLEDALKMYTLGGAGASFQNEDKGSITQGKLADLIVFNRDAVQLIPEQFSELKVVLSIIDGKVVWEA